ncbi:TetR family transcriptional regulator [Dictyobacter alpinus]|uniref:TetR family transcriptional regulator n=2 Tax=Dictyobacter alpinus TaxID=2014873 RepID=A0A402B0E7_9CHLR|nr:TetR family transcriptional regulator [Dictyobacter alpinus]
MATRAGLDHKTIIDTAIRLIDADGLHEVTMATLASQLGVKTPTLYHYFTGLAGLRRDIALQGLKEAAKLLGDAVMGKAGDDAVYALAHSMRTFAKKHPGVYEVINQAPDPNDQTWLASGNEVVTIVRRALSAYALTPDDELHAVRMFRSVVHGCTSLEAIGGFGLPLDIDETFQRLLTMFLHDLHDRQINK